jgi:hypothetical protein
VTLSRQCRADVLDTPQGSVGIARSPTLVAVVGATLVAAGVVAYFVVALHFGALLPRVRNDAIPNWLIVLSGLALCAVGVARARSGRRLVPGLLLGASLVVTGWFAAVLYVVTTVPATPGPAIGRPAPEFAASDQQGHTRNLADFRGAPLLLVFYRGHW